MSDRAGAPVPRPSAPAPSAGDVRFESTFSMDDALFQEYFDARDRSLNRRDGLVWSVVFGVVMLCYIWGTVSVWLMTPWGIVCGLVILALLVSLNRRDGLVWSVVFGVVMLCYIWGTVSVWLMTPWGIVCGLVILALLVYGIVLAVTGFTLHWPRRSWEKTRRHYFARHGSPNGEPFTLRTSACLSEVRACVLRDGRPKESIAKRYQQFSHVEVTERSPNGEPFTLRTSACLSEVRACVLRDGRPKESIAKRYQQFSHVEVTERLVVLVAGDVEVGSILHNLFSSSYAERLEQRADLEDMVFSKADLAGGTPDELVEFLQRKLGHRA